MHEVEIVTGDLQDQEAVRLERVCKPYVPVIARDCKRQSNLVFGQRLLRRVYPEPFVKLTCACGTGAGRTGSVEGLAMTYSRQFADALLALKDREIVFHLGALVAIPYSYLHPFNFVQTNILGTAHVLNAALAYGIERLVHTSTSEVYGTAQYHPIDEYHPLVAQLALLSQQNRRRQVSRELLSLLRSASRYYPAF